MIKSREQIKEFVALQRESNKAIGFTSGAFDIIHKGHVSYLEEAKKQCDILIIGVNSDSSIKSYKDPSRPINSEDARAAVISALKWADAVFIFSETNNNENINILRPDIYFKAGDYNKSSLSSAPLVESYGGKVVIIPFEQGFSTTSIIDRISANSIHSHTKLPTPSPAPALFLDRDGTVNEMVEYLHEPYKFKVIPGAFEAIKFFQDKGYKIIIITNQPGINFGYFTKEDLFSVNKEMMKQASRAGVGIDKIYFCPHVKTENCECRKPSPGMLLRAKDELNIIMDKSIMVGDTKGDIQAGKSAGCKTVQVLTGHGRDKENLNTGADLVVDSLAQLQANFCDLL